MSFTAPEQSPQGDQDPQVAPGAPATPPPVAAPPGSAPWANDLNSIFTDPGVRGQVDNFLREKVQPYTTQLEQKAASNNDAQRLYDAFQSEPVDAYVAITEELFGAEAAQRLLGTIQQQLETQQQPQPPAPGQPAAPAFDDRTQQLLNWVEQQQNERAYDETITAISADPQYADINIDAFHTFVAANGGDFNQAINDYRGYVTKFGQPQTQQTIEAPAPAQEAPPQVLGTDTSAAQASSTPVEPRKQDLNSAIDEFMAENRASAAPPVGAV